MHGGGGGVRGGGGDGDGDDDDDDDDDLYFRAEFWREVGSMRFLSLLERMAQNTKREGCVRDRVCMVIQVTADV